MCLWNTLFVEYEMACILFTLLEIAQIIEHQFVLKKDNILDLFRRNTFGEIKLHFQCQIYILKRVSSKVNHVLRLDTIWGLKLRSHILFIFLYSCHNSTKNFCLFVTLRPKICLNCKFSPENVFQFLLTIPIHVQTCLVPTMPQCGYYNAKLMYKC